MSAGNSTSLPDFLSTGVLGPVVLGLSAKDLADHLGLPDDIDDLNDLNEDLGNIDEHPYGTMVNYGALHLAFIDGELWYFIIDVNDGAGALPERLGITWLDDLRAMNRAEFAVLLAEYGIRAHVASTDDDRDISLRLILPVASIMVLFDLTDDKDEILALHRSVPVVDADTLPIWQYG